MDTFFEKNKTGQKPRKPVYILKPEDWRFENVDGLDVLRKNDSDILIPIQKIVKSVLASQTSNPYVPRKSDDPGYNFQIERGVEIKPNGGFVAKQDKGRASYFQVSYPALPEVGLFIILDEQKARRVEVEGLAKYCYLAINNGAEPCADLDEANNSLTLGKRFNPASETRYGQTVHTSVFLTEEQREKMKEQAAESQDKKRTGRNM